MFSTCADLTSAILYLALMAEQLQPFLLKTWIIVTFSSACIPQHKHRCLYRNSNAGKEVFLGCRFDTTDFAWLWAANTDSVFVSHLVSSVVFWLCAFSVHYLPSTSSIIKTCLIVVVNVPYSLCPLCGFGHSFAPVFSFHTRTQHRLPVSLSFSTFILSIFSLLNW